MHLSACLPSQSFASQMPALPKGEPRSGSEPHTCRIRLSLAQTCPRAALSVTACAVPPSSGRKALVLRADQTCLSLWERCRAATERAGSLVRELACRLAARLREFCQIDKIRMRFALIRICQCLPSQSFASQMPALPKGEPRRRSEPHTCFIRLSLAQACSRAAPSVTACAAPPSSGRKALFPHNPTCLSLWERCRVATERALPFVFLGRYIFPSKKHSAECFFMFSWTMYCRMLGWLRCRQCLRCCQCFLCFRCLRPHRSPWSVPNPRL